MAAGRRAREDVELITDARTSPMIGWHHRRRVYLLLQLLRLPLFIASGVVWWTTHSHLWAVLIVLISLPLPWIAVMLANEPGDPDKDSRKVYKPAVVRENRQTYAQLGGKSAPAVGAGSTIVEDDEFLSDADSSASITPPESEPSDDDTAS